MPSMALSKLPYFMVLGHPKKDGSEKAVLLHLSDDQGAAETAYQAALNGTAFEGAELATVRASLRQETAARATPSPTPAAAPVAPAPAPATPAVATP